MQNEMLAPAAVLVCWTIAVLLWALVSRAAGFGPAGINIRDIPPGARGQDLEGKLPDRIMWRSHNYTHLVEQPTIFYPVVVILALAGAGQIDVTLAWVYVALRIIHSIWQGTINIVQVRGGIFALMTLCLAVLAVRSVMATLLA